jgi:hypothetical protein
MQSENLNKFIEQFVSDPNFREALKANKNNIEAVLNQNGHHLSDADKQYLQDLLQDLVDICVLLPVC